MNPISRLAQIQQAKKEKEPEYMLITERGLPRRREFVMQVCMLFLAYCNRSVMMIYKINRIMATFLLNVLRNYVVDSIQGR